LIAFVAACTSEPTELGQGDRAPAWTAATFDGATVEFPELLDGKPTVMVFWATWCSYCKAFMPYLEDIQSEFGDAINIVTINAKEDGTGYPAVYIGNLDFPMIAVRDGDAIAAEYDVEFIPGLMIADADGVIAYRRAWTELPAGEQVANLWASQVRSNLNSLLR
jgi:thiol-disulfide isomerase/thioredoxin